MAKFEVERRQGGNAEKVEVNAFTAKQALKIAKALFVEPESEGAQYEISEDFI